MENRDNLKLLPTRENHHCFGCSPINDSGLHMRFYTNGEALYSWLTVPAHLSGWRHLVHGGVITTILDEIMGWSAIYMMKSLVLTKSIAVDFLKPVHVGKELRAEGKVARMQSEREVVMEGLLFDSEENLRSRATGVFSILPPDRAKKMGMTDQTVLEELHRLFSF